MIFHLRKFHEEKQVYLYLTAPERRVDQISVADVSSNASDDTAVTGAIFLNGLSPDGKGHVTWGKDFWFFFS